MAARLEAVDLRERKREKNLTGSPDFWFALYLVVMLIGNGVRLRYLFYQLLTLALAGCRAFGNCTYEVRDLDASATISESVGAADSAQVRLEENRALSMARRYPGW
jgi:hypothetical protein